MSDNPKEKVERGGNEKHLYTHESLCLSKELEECWPVEAKSGQPGIWYQTWIVPSMAHAWWRYHRRWEPLILVQVRLSIDRRLEVRKGLSKNSGPSGEV